MCERERESLCMLEPLDDAMLLLLRPHDRGRNHYPSLYVITPYVVNRIVVCTEEWYVQKSGMYRIVVCTE